MHFFHKVICLPIAFKRKLERKWKTITMPNLVEGQASCTDERYLLIIKFLCKIRPKVIGDEELNSRNDFDLLLIY